MRSVLTLEYEQGDRQRPGDWRGRGARGESRARKVGSQTNQRKVSGRARLQWLVKLAWRVWPLTSIPCLEPRRFRALPGVMHKIDHLVAWNMVEISRDRCIEKSFRLGEKQDIGDSFLHPCDPPSAPSTLLLAPYQVASPKWHLLSQLPGDAGHSMIETSLSTHHSSQKHLPCHPTSPSPCLRGTFGPETTLRHLATCYRSLTTFLERRYHG